MVSLRGRPRTRREPLARAGRLDQVAGVQLVEAGDGAERGVRLLRSTTGSGFGFEVLVDRGFDIGRAWLGGQPLVWWSPAGLIGPWLHDPAGIGWSRLDDRELRSSGSRPDRIAGGYDAVTAASVAGPRLSAGVLTADLTRLGAEVDMLRGTGCWVHVDVMDGTFCPQLTVGPAFAAAVAAIGIPVDVHVLADEPRWLLPDIVATGLAVVTVYAEAIRHLHRMLQELAAVGAAQDPPVLRGVAISPGTQVQVIGPVLELVDLVLVLAADPGWPGHLPAASTQRRVRTVQELAAGLDIAVQVGVDGGITIANAAEVASWGADVLVSGSEIYDGIDPPATCAACSTSCVPQLASRTPPLAEEEAHVHQRHTPDRPAANPYEDHPDRRGSP
jgi:ribulose-phosphate 3-epimerase